MAQDFKKAFEKESKIDFLQEQSFSDFKKEKGDPSKEVSLESSAEKMGENLSAGAEEKKSLEKSGEALKKISGSAAKISDSDQELMKKIDDILSEGLVDVFLKMDPIKQKLFKEEGEKTIYKITELLSHTKFKVSKIIELIKNWLKIIPGINRYFLEQEAKIKTDKIIKLKK